MQSLPSGICITLVSVVANHFREEPYVRMMLRKRKTSGNLFLVLNAAHCEVQTKRGIAIFLFERISLYLVKAVRPFVSSSSIFYWRYIVLPQIFPTEVSHFLLEVSAQRVQRRYLPEVC